MLPRLVPVIRKGTAEDAQLLAELGERTFRDAFAAQNTAENLQRYLAQAFGEEKQRTEVSDPTATFFLAFVGAAAAGYLVLRSRNAPSCVTEPEPIEVERLYVDRPFWGTGVSTALMERAEQEARERGCQSIWLAVWEHNARARAFYRRRNFREVGKQLFVLGTDPQTDLILVRRL